MPNILGPLNGSRWLMRTDDPDVIYVRVKTWAGWINPNCGWEGFVDARDPNAKSVPFDIFMHTAMRHRHVAEAAGQEVQAWLASRQGYSLSL
jgi:hypothetical protein